MTGAAVKIAGGALLGALVLVVALCRAAARGDEPEPWRNRCSRCGARWGGAIDLPTGKDGRRYCHAFDYTGCLKRAQANR